MRGRARGQNTTTTPWGDQVGRWTERVTLKSPLPEFVYLCSNGNEITIRKESGAWRMSVWSGLDPAIGVRGERVFRREIAGDSTGISEVKAIALALYRMTY